MNSTRLIYFGKEYEDLYQTQLAVTPSRRNVKAVTNKTLSSKCLRTNESYIVGIKSDAFPSYHKADTKNLEKSILDVETHLQQSSIIESPSEITACELLASLMLSFRQSTSTHTSTEDKVLNINLNYTDDERQDRTDKYFDSDPASEIVDQNKIKYDDSRNVEQSNNDFSIYSLGLALDDNTDDCLKRITQGIRESIEAKLLEYEESASGGCTIENVIDNSHRVTVPCDGKNECMQLSSPLIREFADRIIMVSDHSDESKAASDESKAANEKQLQAALGIWTSSGEYSPVHIDPPSRSLISRIHKLLSCYEGEEDTNVMKRSFQSSAAVAVDGLSASTIESNDQAFDIDHIRHLNIFDGNEVYESEKFDLVGKVILLQQIDKKSNHRDLVEDVTRGINQTEIDAYSREDDRDAKNARQPHLAIHPDLHVAMDIASHTIASTAGKDYCSYSNYAVDNNSLVLVEKSIIQQIDIEMASAGYEVESKDNIPSIPLSERLDDNPNILNMGILPPDDHSENDRLISKIVNSTTQEPLHYKKERRVDHYLFDEMINSSLSATHTRDKYKRDDYFTLKSFSTSSEWSFDSISLNSYPSRNSTGRMKKAANNSHGDTLSMTEDNSLVSFDTDITRYFKDVTTHQIYLDHTSDDKSESDEYDKYALDLNTDL